MHKIKSHKTVDQIAKKHRLNVSFIKNQLEMGVPIENEHTHDKDLATDIALQHLDEIPDYYTRLKKMESDAKKEHKKFKDVKESIDGKSAKDPNYSLKDWFKGGGWVQTGGKYDGKPCAKQPGQTTKPYCRDPDDRAALSKDERNQRAAKKRKEDPNPNRSGEAKMVTQESAGEKDACYKKVKSRYKVWPSAYASGALVKCRKVGADNWGTKTEATQMIRYCPKCKKDETRDECRYGPKYWDMFSLPSKLSSVAMSNPHYHANSPHPGNMPEGYDHEHSMARSEISTIISAAKRIRKKMKGEGNIEAWVQSKITKAADYLDSAADYVDSGEMKVENVESGPLLPGERRRVFPKGTKKVPTGAKLPIIQKAHYEPEGEVIDEKCWSGYQPKGMKKKGNRMVPNCVKSEVFSNWRAEFGLSEDWQKVNRKDRTDGLSQAAVNAYRREHPGSNLKTAVTEKNPSGKRANRRSNYCSRSAGQRDMHNIDCSKTPDKPICKARRRWRCGQ